MKAIDKRINTWKHLLRISLMIHLFLQIHLWYEVTYRLITNILFERLNLKWLHWIKRWEDWIQSPSRINKTKCHAYLVIYNIFSGVKLMAILNNASAYQWSCLPVRMLPCDWTPTFFIIFLLDNACFTVWYHRNGAKTRCCNEWSS